MKPLIRGIVVLAVVLTSILGMVMADSRVNPGGHRAAIRNSARNLQTPAATNFNTILPTGGASPRFNDLTLSIPRANHSATTLLDERIIFVGGQNQDGPVSVAELFDPVLRRLSKVAVSISARVNHTATLLPDGRVLVIGGSNNRGALVSTEVFDPAANSFSPGPSLHKPRAGHTATVLKDGRILVAGGRADGSAEIFDNSTERFTLLNTAMKIPRSFHSAILLNNGNVLLVGDAGYHDGDTAEIFSASDKSFSPTVNWLQVNRVRPVLRVLPDGKVQIIGGDDKGTIEIYDPWIDRFRNCADLNTTADLLGLERLLRAGTRTAFVAGIMNQQKAESRQAQPSGRSVADDTDDKRLARADYTYSEVEHLNQGVIAGGVDSSGRFLQSVILLEASPSTVTTDRVEYVQQGNLTINGAGWMPGEEVLIVQQESRNGRRTFLKAVVDKRGNFASRDMSLEHDVLGVYILTVIGQSSNYVAQTTYRIAPPPDLEVTKKYTKPFRVKALLPVGAERGTVQTDLGPLNWEATPMSGVKFVPDSKTNAKRENKAGGIISPQISTTYDLFTFNLPWSGVSFSIPGTPITVDSSGTLTGKAFLEISAQFDPGDPFNCCDPCIFWCPILPSASAFAGLVAQIDLHTVNDITFEGNFKKNDILVFPIETFKAEIPGTPFRIDLTLGLFAGIEITADRPTKFHTTLDVLGTEARAGIGAGFSIIPPDAELGPKFDINAPTVTGSAELVQFGGGCLKLSLGPGIKGEIKLIDIEICDLELEAYIRTAAFVKGCVDPITDTDSCQIYQFSLSAGIQGDLSGKFKCLASLPADFDESRELLNIPIISSDRFVFRDTGPPVISCPDDIVTSAFPGLCSAVVGYATPAVSDDCSGVSSLACIPPSGATFQKGVTSVTCTATDGKGNVGRCSLNVTVNDTERPVIPSPPVNIVKSTDPGRCSAVTVFATPAAIDNCPGVSVVCSPASGFAFSKGTTTVTCTATDTSSNVSATSFTVKVNDTEKPNIGCAASQTVVAATPGSGSVVVNYPMPSFSDNCPGASVSCVPPSGSVFGVGVTTVVCTAIDASLNSTQCSFSVNVFDVCLQDDSDRQTELLYNSFTGDYRFCGDGVRLTGTGTPTRRGGTFTLQHFPPDRRLLSQLDSSQNRGTVSVRYGGRLVSIIDRDIRNNTITCQ